MIRLVYPFKADKIEDFEVRVREAIAEWRRYNPNRNLLGIDCTALVENARSSVVRHTP